jgi:hypothetical protein
VKRKPYWCPVCSEAKRGRLVDGEYEPTCPDCLCGMLGRPTKKKEDK